MKTVQLWVLAITVNRIGSNKGAVGATLTLTDGTAVAADYTNTPIAINFAAGDTTQKLLLFRSPMTRSTKLTKRLIYL